MLIFIVIILAIAIVATSFIRKRNKPVPAIETPKPFSNNRFKEEFAMKKRNLLKKELKLPKMTKLKE